MKRITIIFPNEVNLSCLAELISQATDVRIETLETDAPSARKHRNRIPGMNAKDIIMQHFSPEAVFTRNTALSWLTAKGYAKSNTPLTRLVAENKIRALGNDKFQFVRPE